MQLIDENEAQAQFEQVLNNSVVNPIGITRNGELRVVMVSFETYQAYLSLSAFKAV